MKGRFVVTVRNFAEASQALRVADIIEFRLDLFPSYPEYDRIQTEKDNIVTIRRKEDGGQFDGEEEDRLELLRKYSKYASYVDLEHELDDEVFLKFEKNNIVESYHNFAETPDYDVLKDIVEGRRGDIIKIATMGRSKEDVIKIMKLLTEYDNVVAFLMGRKYSFTRIISLLMGSPLIYCSLYNAVAPGQYDIYTARKILKMI
ncbi:type I 3-dehydroquinate dehydratase [Geoglobus acetivorans]|uniref:3-dehydroquinate dehydratase n=1 Tax=Geoglobus acetivorans TaxID=565033 RepID=A0ABZ3H559_GEOAI|nr:type I 3-dehydroquinate dehydratase [Geoglobus acetivorans]